MKFISFLCLSFFLACSQDQATLNPSNSSLLETNSSPLLSSNLNSSSSDLSSESKNTNTSEEVNSSSSVIPTNPETPKRIVAYLPSYRSLNSFDMAKLTHICWAFVNPEQNYSITTGKLESLREMVTKAHNNNVKALASVGGGGLSETIRATWELGMKDEKERLIDSLIAFIDRENMDGIDLDLEGAAITKDYTPFAEALGKALHAKGKLFTMAIGTWKGPEVGDAALAQYDFINLMAYDLSGPWKSDAVAHSPMSFALSNIKYWEKTRKVAKDKIVLGVPFYGFDTDYVGSNDYSSSYTTFADIAQNNTDSVDVDKIGTLHYNGKKTIAAKTQLAAQYGGIMIWEIGQDAPAPHSLLDVIVENMK